MKRTYSLYEAKARLSEIIRAVREHGDTAIVSWHGEPVAEIRPIEGGLDEMSRKLARLEAGGILVAPDVADAAFPAPSVRRAAALKRFLQDRDG
jgi:prevent-host-death family protein